MGTTDLACREIRHKVQSGGFRFGASGASLTSSIAFGGLEYFTAHGSRSAQRMLGNRGAGFRIHPTSKSPVAGV